MAVSCGESTALSGDLWSRDAWAPHQARSLVRAIKRLFGLRSVGSVVPHCEAGYRR